MKNDNGPPVRRGPLSVLDIAIARGARVIDGNVDGAELAAMGLPIIPGCARCSVTLSPADAYPAPGRFYFCGACIDGLGFDTVEAYDEHGGAGHERKSKY
jgi:hypothetical protein